MLLILKPENNSIKLKTALKTSHESARENNGAKSTDKAGILKGPHASRAATLTSTSVIALKTLPLPPQLTKSDADISDIKAKAAAAGRLREDGGEDGGGSDAGAAADTDCKNCEIPQRPGGIGGGGGGGDESKEDCFKVASALN